ncbi:MAG: hypothetical protein U0175_16910 [Caldilineaceae bacterium]
MKGKRLLQVGLFALGLMSTTLVAQAHPNADNKTVTLVDTVRQETARYKNVEEAKKAGYGLLHGCVSGPQEGAMGVHFANGDLVGDNEIDAAHPEALLYEPRSGKMELVGVEYVVLADGWNAKHPAPPVLMGQLFNYVSTPNRYGLPAFYELHVWAWQSNPSGVFADWNPRVSCESYVGDATVGGHH